MNEQQPWWVETIKTLGIPTAMCGAMAFGIWQAGGRLVDSHIQHLSEVSVSIKATSEAIQKISVRMDTIERKIGSQ